MKAKKKTKKISHQEKLRLFLDDKKGESKFLFFWKDKFGNKTPKERIRSIFNFFKWFFYSFFIIVALVGCVQNFVLKTSYRIGSGLEIYSKDQEVYPQLVNFKFSNSQKIYTPDLKSQVFESDKNSPEVERIKKAKKQISDSGGSLVKYDSKSGLVNIVYGFEEDASQKFVYSNDGKYLAYASDLKEYNYVEKWTKIKYYSLVYDDKNKEISEVKELKTSFVNDKIENFKEPLTRFNRDLLEILVVKTIARLKEFYQLQNFDFDAIKVGSKLNLNQKNFLRDYNLALARYFAQINSYSETEVVALFVKKSLVNKTEDQVVNFDDPSLNKKNVNFIPFVDKIPTKIIGSFSQALSYGPFYGFFVYPLAYINKKVIGTNPSWSWISVFSIIISVILVRAITVAISYKGTIDQYKIQDLSTKKARIEAKYLAMNDPQSKQKSAREVNNLYKKYGISQASTFLSAIITIPFLITIWRVLSSLPEFKASNFGGINFVATSYKEVFEGLTNGWPYLILIIFTIIVQLISSFLPKFLQRKKEKRLSVLEIESLKKSNKTMYIMQFVFLFISIIFQAGIQIYWIISGVWTIFQTLIIYFIYQSKKKKAKSK